MMTRWVAGVVLLFGILLLMLPRSNEQSLARIASASMLARAKDLRSQVASQVINDRSVNAQGELVLLGTEWSGALELR